VLVAPALVEGALGLRALQRLGRRRRARDELDVDDDDRGRVVARGLERYRERLPAPRRRHERRGVDRRLAQGPLVDVELAAPELDVQPRRRVFGSGELREHHEVPVVVVGPGRVAVGVGVGAGRRLLLAPGQQPELGRERRRRHGEAPAGRPEPHVEQAGHGRHGMRAAARRGV
jgi:hypothetical protein